MADFIVHWGWYITALFGAVSYLCALSYWTSGLLVRMYEFYICPWTAQDSDQDLSLPWGAVELWLIANAILAAVPAILAEIALCLARRRRARLMLLTVYHDIPDEGVELGVSKRFVEVPDPLKTEEMESWLIAPVRGTEWVMRQEPWRRPLISKEFGRQKKVQR